MSIWDDNYDFGPTTAVPDSTWNFSMPESGDLLKYNPNLTGDSLSRLLGLGSIGAMNLPNTTVPDLRPNAGNNPGVAALYGKPMVGTGAGGAPMPPPPSGPGFGSKMLELVQKNPAALLALLSAGGAGIAGAVKGSDTVKLPKEVSDLARRASAPMAPDPYAEAALDRQMRRDIGPGWETSTPGIQAKEYATYLRQKGDQGTAAAALGPIGSLYGNAEANKSKEQQNLYSLAALLGTLGLGSIGKNAFSFAP